MSSKKKLEYGLDNYKKKRMQELREIDYRVENGKPVKSSKARNKIWREKDIDFDWESKGEYDG